MTEFRLLLTGEDSGARNMAVDEAIMREFRPGDKPTVRLYGWRPPAVTIGYFQAMGEEVNLEACSRFGVDVVRRITGGGAVFHDAELTYSFVCGEESGLVPKNILRSYSVICNSIVSGLRHLGIEAGFKPLNDVVANGKKISGNAQTRRDRVLLQHGTVLIRVDVEKMFSLLKVPDEKLLGKMIEDAKQRVTSVEEQVGREIYFEEVSQAIQQGFSENFRAELVKGGLSFGERALAEKIEKERFGSDGWTYLR